MRTHKSTTTTADCRARRVRPDDGEPPVSAQIERQETVIAQQHHTSGCHLAVDLPVDREVAIERARERLQQLSLPERVLDSYPHQLSGGMKQRVVAVLSTLLNPRLLIADEPTSALDVSSQRALIDLLVQLLDRKIIQSILFISHDLPLLSNVADRIAVMYAGEIVDLGTTQQIVRDPQHPYTRALLRSTLVPERTLRGQRIEGIPGQPPDLRKPPPGCRFHPRCPHAMERCARERPSLQSINGRQVACWWVFERHGIVSSVEGSVS